MKICCVSDTHISGGMGKLPQRIYEDFKGCDLILHAGDITSLDVIEDLKLIAPVTAVAGNMDGWDVSERLPEKQILQAGRFRIGLTHGCCRVPGMEERILGYFENDNVDCIVYGHSHQPKVAYVGGVLMVNPGSPTDKTYAPYNSYAVIHVGEELTAEIVRI
ncbi:MAG: metallophosphoesterase family protein [Nitrospirae bacterium]|nr:metallophosphoesterase family protein [Nitrospirota bacterium]